MAVIPTRMWDSQIDAGIDLKRSWSGFSIPKQKNKTKQNIKIKDK